MKYILFFMFFLMVSNADAQKKSVAKAAPVNGFAVVELFTSAGNAVCPPADSLLKKLNDEARKNNQQIYVMAFHVDYWNRFGWNDPYSKLAYSNRQKDYMFKLNLKDMSIPQIIVNGTQSFVGSQEKNVRTAISNSLKQESQVTIQIKNDSLVNDTLFIGYQSSSSDKNFYLRIAVVENGLITKPNAGDTKGKTLTHTNVVRAFYSGNIELKNGTAKVPLRKYAPNKNCSIIAFIQNKKTSKVLGATQIAF